MGAVLNLDSLRQTSARLQLQNLEIPVLPAMASRLLEQIAAEEIGLQEVAETIANDPGLAATCITLANTAHYTRGFEVTDIQRAVITLGTRMVRTVALNIYFVEAMRSKSVSGLNMAVFWRDSLLRACIAREIARELIPRLADVAYLVGLIQDIGLVVLAHNQAPLLEEMLDAASGDSLYLHAIEKENNVIDHATVAAHLAQKWQLPAIIATAIANHHSKPPVTTSTDDTLFIWELSYFCGCLPMRMIQRGEPIEDTASFAQSRWVLKPEKLQRIYEQANSHFDALKIAVRPMVPANCNVAPIIHQLNRLLS